MPDQLGRKLFSNLALGVSVALTIVTVVLTVSVQAADDFEAQRAGQWHQWRGPEATGVAPQGNPPVEWSEDKNVRWKIEIPGKGGSTPIVWNGRVYVASAVNTGKVDPAVAKPEDQPERPFGIKYPNTLYRYQLLCYDLESGREIWEQTAIESLPHEGHHGDNTFASSSPTTDGKAIYVSFGSRGLYSFTLDGQLRWKYELNNVRTRLSFGEASSPVVAQGRVVLVRDNEDQSQILVLDAATGQLQWKADRKEVSAWATPLVTEFQGKHQVVTNASERVRSYDLSTGDVIWECGGQVANVIPSPLRYEERVVCMSGYRGSIAMSLPLSSHGDISDSDKIAWRYDRDTPYVPSALLYDDRLYFTKSNSAVLTCLDIRTGKPLLEATRLQGISNVYASPVGAAGRVYITGRDGTTLVLEHSRQTSDAAPKVLATNKLDDPIDASPAIVGDKLLLRGHKFLYCLGQPK